MELKKYNVYFLRFSLRRSNPYQVQRDCLNSFQNTPKAKNQRYRLYPGNKKRAAIICCPCYFVIESFIYKNVISISKSNSSPTTICFTPSCVSRIPFTDKMVLPLIIGLQFSVVIIRPLWSTFSYSLYFR